MLKAPRLAEASSETTPRPLVEVTIPTPRRISSLASCCAPRAPPPSQRSGRFAAISRSAMSSITLSLARGRCGSGAWTRSWGMAGLRCTSTGISRLTGPVGAEIAADTAAVSAPMAPLASHMR